MLRTEQGLRPSTNTHTYFSSFLCVKIYYEINYDDCEL